MTKVSLFPNIKVRDNGADVAFNDIMYHIKEGRWAEKINMLRQQKAIGAEKEQLELIKQSLPYFTASGIFKTRKTEGLLEHSGKIAIDFDNIDPDKMNHVREELINDKYSEYVFISCSGSGYCVIVNIAPDQTGEVSTRHLDSFLFLEGYYKRCYNLTIDKSCKDVTRARFISYDSNLFYNSNYEKIDISKTPISVTIDSDEEKYELAKKIHDGRFQFVEGQRHHYLLVLAFWLNKCGVSKEYSTDKLMEYVGNGKTAQEITRIINDCYKNQLDHGTYTLNKKISDLPQEYSENIKKIFAYAHAVNNAGNKYTDLDIKSQCKQHLLSEAIVENVFKNVFKNNKDAFGIDSKPDIYKIEYFINKRYEIAKNEITHRIEFRIKGTNDKWELLNEHSIYREMMHAGFKFTLEKLKSLLKSDYVLLRNPIREYFESLPEWSEEEIDYISDLAKFIKTDNDIFWSTQFKKALVRNIACVLDYKENRIIIVLVEPNQNTGKTSFIRFLIPPALGDYYTETAMDANKDSDIQLSENFIWNLEELASLNTYDINKLKATISRSTVKQRKPYAEFHESNPRRVNFWASTNKTEFLADDQNTRWLCFNVIGINHDYNNKVTGIKKININNVWAQAYTLYKRGLLDKTINTPEGPKIIPGYNYNLTKEEAEYRDKSNKDYELVSVEKDLIIKFFINKGRAGGEFMTYTDILIFLIKETDNKVKLNIRTIAQSMRQLGYENTTKKVDGATVKGFWCSLKTALQQNISYLKPEEIPGPTNLEDTSSSDSESNSESNEVPF